ncbi:cupin domain-containing protein [Azospira restricta]|uniref:Cupin domain-containing protein n=1 Tax=Azospira restricta TaxID=404405 RepID=A0A974Y5H9_9RHOO|nr:cupin domain-containing protein [Azospira restricta]QRJ65388.1 cupin domain-containing protein [Azospira restricta]
MSRNTPLAVEHGPNFSAGHLGPFADLMQYEFVVPALGNRKVPGKVFLKEPLALSGAEMSWNCFPPGLAMPFLHAHREHEEVYLFIAGSGEFMVDDRVFPVAEGSVVRVAPAGVRAYRNTGDTPLHFIVLQVRAGSLSASTVDDGIVVHNPLRWPESAAA